MTPWGAPDDDARERAKRAELAKRQRNADRWNREATDWDGKYREATQLAASYEKQAKDAQRAGHRGTAKNHWNSANVQLRRAKQYRAKAIEARDKAKRALKG